MLETVKLIPVCHTSFHAIVDSEKVLPPTHYQSWRADDEQEYRNRYPDEAMAWGLARAASIPTIMLVANDYRERMDLGHEDIEVYVKVLKHTVAERPSLHPPDPDPQFRPHLDIRSYPEYFASIGKPTRYWSGKFAISPIDQEDNNDFYEQQIEEQKIYECTLPENSVICIDEHLVHAAPVSTDQDVGTDRLFVVLSPNLPEAKF